MAKPAQLVHSTPQVVEGWRRIYGMKTGEFTVPPDFTESSAKAVKRRDEPTR